MAKEAAKKEKAAKAEVERTLGELDVYLGNDERRWKYYINIKVKGK